MMQPYGKLRTNSTWKEACSLAEYMYDELEKESANFPDNEDWNTKSKIRNSCNDVIFYVAQALGSRSPGGNEYEWNIAKKYLSGLFISYLFAGKRKFLRLEPDIVVRIGSLMSTVDAEIIASREAAKQRDQDELEPWLAKLKVFEKMNGGNSSVSN